MNAIDPIHPGGVWATLPAAAVVVTAPDPAQRDTPQLNKEGAPALPLTLTPVSGPPAAPEPWVSAAAACTYLDVSPATLRRWVRAGRLTSHRTPTGGLRFRLTALDAALTATSSPKPAAGEGLI